MMKNTRQANFWENCKKYVLHKYGIEILLGNYWGNHSTFNCKKGETFKPSYKDDAFNPTDLVQRQPDNVQALEQSCKVQPWEVGQSSGQFLYKKVLVAFKV